jgi:lipopolysaccharide export system permease protein
MKRVGRSLVIYLAASVLKLTLLVWMVIIGFDLIMAFYTTFSNVGKNGFTVNHAILSTLLTAPRRAYDLLPVASIIGLLLGLGQLASKSELIAMASVGVSRFYIALGAVLPLLLLSGVMVVVYETAGIAGEKQALVVNTHKSFKFSLARNSGVWAKDGDWYFNARAGSAKGQDGSAWLELADVSLYQIDGNGVLASITQARSASNQKSQWLLRDVSITRFSSDKVSVERIAELPWKTQITNESLEATLSNPGNLRINELSSNIAYLERNNLDARAFITAYWGRWFYPLKIIVLCLAVLPFAFGSLRSGGFGKSLFIGIVVGISAILLEDLFVNFAEVYRIDVRLAYLLAPATVFGLCWGYLAKRI